MCSVCANTLQRGDGIAGKTATCPMLPRAIETPGVLQRTTFFLHQATPVNQRSHRSSKAAPPPPSREPSTFSRGARWRCRFSTATAGFVQPTTTPRGRTHSLTHPSAAKQEQALIASSLQTFFSPQPSNSGDNSQSLKLLSPDMGTTATSASDGCFKRWNHFTESQGTLVGSDL